MKEADGSELGVGWRSWAGALERRSVVRIARSKIWSAAPATRTSCTCFGVDLLALVGVGGR